MTLVCAGPIPDDTRRHMSRSPHRQAPIHAVLSGWDEGLLPPPVRSLLPAKGTGYGRPRPSEGHCPHGAKSLAPGWREKSWVRTCTT